MPTELDSVFVKIEARLERLETQLDEAVRTSRQKGTQAGEAFSGAFQSRADRLAETLSNLAQFAVAGTIVNQFRAMAQEASNAQIQVELFVRQLRRVGQNADEGLAALESLAQRLGTIPAALADNATQLLRQGLTFQEVITVFERAAASGLAAGQSTQQAIEAVTQAIVNQQSVYLNYAGISQNLDVAYREFAKTLGKTVDALTTQEKAQAAVNLIVKATAEEYEDLDRLLGGVAGSTAQLERQMQLLRQALGNAVTPAVTTATSALTSLLTAVNSLPQPIKSAIANVTLFGAAITAVGASIGLLIPGLRNLLTTFPAIATAATTTATAIRGVAAALLSVPGAVAVATTALATWSTNVARSIYDINAKISKDTGRLDEQIGRRLQQLRNSQDEIDRLSARRLAIAQRPEFGQQSDEGRRLREEYEKLSAAIQELTRRRRADAEAVKRQQFDKQIDDIRRLNAALAEAEKRGDVKAILAAKQALDQYIGSNEQFKAILAAVEQERRVAEQNLQRQTKAQKEATKAVDEWKNTLSTIAFERFVAGLDSLTFAQLKSAAATALAARNSEQYRAILNEIQQREAAIAGLLNNERVRARAQAFTRLSDDELESRRRRAIELRDEESLSLVLNEQNRRREERLQAERQYWELYTQGAEARFIGERTYNRLVEETLAAERERADLSMRIVAQRSMQAALEEQLAREQELQRARQESERLAQQLKPPAFELDIDRRIPLLVEGFRSASISLEELTTDITATIEAFQQALDDIEDKSSDEAIALRNKIASLQNVLPEITRQLEEQARRFAPPPLEIDIEGRVPLLIEAYRRGVLALQELTDSIADTIAAFEQALADIDDKSSDEALALQNRIAALRDTFASIASQQDELARRFAPPPQETDPIEASITALSSSFERGRITFEQFAEGIRDAIAALQADLEAIDDKTSPAAQAISDKIEELQDRLERVSASRLTNEISLLNREFGLGIISVSTYTERIGELIVALEQQLAGLDATSPRARELGLLIAELRQMQNQTSPTIPGTLGTDYLAEQIQAAQQVGQFIAQQGVEATTTLGRAIIAAFTDGAASAAQILGSGINNLLQSLGNRLLQEQISGFAKAFGRGGLGAALDSLNPLDLLLGIGLPLIGNLISGLFGGPSAAERESQLPEQRTIQKMQLNYNTTIQFNIEGSLDNPVTQAQIETRIQNVIVAAISDYDRRVVRPALESLGVRFA
jgi:DNA repair exonuclease SbcCD ATPase subunit